MRRRCIGAKHSTEIVGLMISKRISGAVAHSQGTGSRAQRSTVKIRPASLTCRIKIRRDLIIRSFSKSSSGRGASPSAVKVHCEVCWSVGEGECWDE